MLIQAYTFASRFALEIVRIAVTTAINELLTTTIIQIEGKTRENTKAATDFLRLVAYIGN